MAKDLMTENPVTIDFNSTMSEAASLMQKSRVHELVVVRNNEPVGMLSCRSLVERSVKTDQKISGSMFMPPFISAEESLDDVVNILLFCGSRDLPVTSGGQLVGVISEIDVIKTLANNRTARDVMRPIKHYARLGSSVTDAREKIIKHKINRLPVVDESGKLRGILSTIDMLDILFPKKSQRIGERGGEKTAAVNVDNVMETKVFTVGPGEKINNVVNLIKNNRISSVIVVENGLPAGIITPKCLLSLMAPTSRTSANVVITGLSDYNMKNKLAVDRLVRKSLSRMERITNPIAIILDFKEHRKQENKGKTNYEIKSRVKASDGNFFSSSSGWSLSKTVNDVLDGLEKEIKKKIGKRA